jgi:hypothetical protein
MAVINVFTQTRARVVKALDASDGKLQKLSAGFDSLREEAAVAHAAMAARRTQRAQTVPLPSESSGPATAILESSDCKAAEAALRQAWDSSWETSTKATTNALQLREAVHAQQRRRVALLCDQRLAVAQACNALVTALDAVRR